MAMQESGSLRTTFKPQFDELGVDCYSIFCQDQWQPYTYIPHEVDPNMYYPEAVSSAPAHRLIEIRKKLMREGQGVSFDTIMEMSAAYQSLAHLTEDHHEAVAAFFEKRPPDYKGR